MKTTSDIETSQRREQQSRIRRPLVAQVRREIAAGEYDQHLDAAIDRLIESGDLSTESTPRCGRCGESMPIAAYSHGGVMVCVTCYLSLSDDAGSAMEGDRWE